MARFWNRSTVQAESTNKPRFGGTRTLQVFLMGKTGTNLLMGVVLARLVPHPPDLAPFEGLWWMFTLSSFAFVGGLSNQMMALGPRVRPTNRLQVAANTQRFATWAASFSGMLVWGYGLALLPGWELAAGAMGLFAFGTLFSLPLEYGLWLERRYAAVLVVGGGTALAQFFAAWLPLHMGHGLQASCFAFGLLGLLRACLHLAGTRALRGVRPSVHLQKWQVGRAWPFVALLLIGGLAAHLDALWIQLFGSATDFVHFRYGARELPIIAVAASALSTSNMAQMAGSGWANPINHTRLRKQTHQLMLWAFPLSWLLLLAAPVLFHSVYGPQYAEAALIFQIYILVVISRVAFPQAILSAQGAMRVQLSISVLELALHSILAAAFAAIWGGAGVAAAACLAHYSEKLLLIRYLKALGIPLKSYFPIRAWVIFTALTLAFALLAWLRPAADVFPWPH